MMVSETDRRYSLFYENNVKDIHEYNKLKGVIRLPYEVIIIDEYADLQHEKDCFGAIELLARKARACGIHLILSTQRPDANVLSGAIKCNISNIVGLKTLNSTNSSIILGQPGLELLPGKGRGIFKRAGVMTEFQAPLLTYEFCRELVSKLYDKSNFMQETYTKGRNKTDGNIAFEKLEAFK
jgi:S-DNA-T family DNA segregation ATPase FtsK/SpoIIIE